jgi:hypothetical protein
MVAYGPSPDFDVPSLKIARLIAIARRTLPWLIGPVVLLLRGRPLELADPSPCPGLLELTSIGVLRSRPDLRVGDVMDALQFVVMAAAMAAFVALVCRRTHSLTVAVATAMAIGVGPFFPSAVALPWEAAAFGVAAAAAQLIALHGEKWPDRRFTSRLILIAVASAALLLVPMWVLGGRLSVAAPRACVIPAQSPIRAIAIATMAEGWLGPFALGLAVLGAFTELQRVGRRAVLLAAVATTAVLVALSATALSNVVVAAPLLVLLWTLAAIGLNEVIAAAGATMPARLVAAAIVLLLPLSAASRRVTEERDDWIVPRGQGQQTLRSITTLLNVVPAETAFVAEDASIDLLLRAAVFGGRRKGKPITVVASDPDAVERALATHAVYAFPRRQDELALRGFVVDAAAAARLATGSGRDLDGLAQISGRRVCQRIGSTWADFDGEAERFAVSADSEAARGPAVIYLAGPSPGAPVPDGWSRRMLRGFGYTPLDRLTPAGVDRVRAEARAAGLTETHPVFLEPFVIRFSVHRTPRAPLALAVSLGTHFPVGLVKLEDRARDVGRLMICDAPPTPTSPLPPRN